MASFNFIYIWSSSPRFAIGSLRRCYRTTRAIFSKVCLDFAAQLAELDGQDHHVHWLVNDPAKHSLSALLNRWRGVSSRLLRLERPDLVRRYWKGVLGSPSYLAATCSGAPSGALKQYIEHLWPVFLLWVWSTARAAGQAVESHHEALRLSAFLPRRAVGAGPNRGFLIVAFRQATAW